MFGADPNKIGMCTQIYRGIYQSQSFEIDCELYEKLLLQINFTKTVVENYCSGFLVSATVYSKLRENDPDGRTKTFLSDVTARDVAELQTILLLMISDFTAMYRLPLKSGLGDMLMASVFEFIKPESLQVVTDIYNQGSEFLRKGD